MDQHPGGQLEHAADEDVQGNQVYRLRVVLAGISPLIWRQLEVTAATTLAELHRLVQAAFGWSGEHLHRFTVRGTEYAAGDGQGLWAAQNADSVGLGSLGLRVRERFTYDYAFFANLCTWRHDLRVQAIERLAQAGATRGAAAEPAAPLRRTAAAPRPSSPCASSIPHGPPPCAWPS